MKLIISSSELLRGVMAVAKAIPAKSPLPILENFLFDLKGNMLEITASDSELTLKTQIEVESTAEEGRIAVPAKHMMDLLKELPDQPLARFQRAFPRRTPTERTRRSIRLSPYNKRQKARLTTRKTSLFSFQRVHAPFVCVKA